MDAVSFALSVTSAVDLCIKCGKELVSKCQAYQDADHRISLLVIRLQNIWIRSEEQITALENIWQFLLHLYQVHQERILRELYSRLQAAILEINALARSKQGIITGVGLKFESLGPWKRARYCLIESSLQVVLDDLEAWQRRFDPSWYLIIRIANSGVDNALTGVSKGTNAVSSLQLIRRELQKKSASKSSKSVIRQPHFLLPCSSTIPWSTSMLAKAHVHPHSIIVDTTSYPVGTDFAMAAGYVDNLARLLSASDPSTLGLLTCLGVIPLPGNEGESSQFQLLFEVPSGLMDPFSLRSMLAGPPGPLHNRFTIAKSLARSVLSVHTAAFIHKNIRPETIISFKKIDTEGIVPFLVGFERFRLAVAGTAMVGDMHWERNIYRHPSRQGIFPEDYYEMQHDVYSLGVCLLEIGLWISFVSLSENPTPAAALNISDIVSLKNKREAAGRVKNRFLHMAQVDLPPIMGKRYADVVVDCLACLDPGKSSVFNDHQAIQDDDGIVLEVDYIERILERLESIRV